MPQLTSSTLSGYGIRPDSRTVIAERIRGEFREMPGLTLTLAQARRLWSLDSAICDEVLSQLVDAGFLLKRSDGTFCRTSDLVARRCTEA
jgi:hypothetical protein